VYPQYIKIVLNTYEKDFRGIKIIAKECSDWAKDMNKHKLDHLNSLLKEKFGKDLYSDTDLKKINAILSRGEIKNLKE
jgi:hypothetical protein